MIESQLKVFVQLEDALNIAGVGLYNNYVMFAGGFILFSAMLGINVMSITIPAASCELGLSTYEKGLLSSMSFTGMIFSSFLFGFLADTQGRRVVILRCIMLNAVLTLLSSIAPNSISLMFLVSINGFILGGVFSPLWVYISEFCPQKIRAKCVLIPSCISTFALVYLPAMAWVIMPMDISIPIVGNLIFTSWRLFIALITIPVLISALLIYRLPESPKFMLNIGEEKKTLETLSTMFAVNERRSRDDYPVQNVCLDSSDQFTLLKQPASGSGFTFFMKTLTQQTIAIFKPPYLFYSALSIVLLFGVVGAYNILYLWCPEKLRILMQFHETQENYNSTLCEVIEYHRDNRKEDQNACEVNYDIFIIGAITAIVQSTIFFIISFIADKAGRKTLVLLFGSLSVATGTALIYVNSFLLTIGSLSSTVILFSTLFPLTYSIIVDYFPTSLRSTASSITIVFGRIGASAGNQVFGAVFETHCTYAYWGIDILMFCSVILAFLMPSHRPT